MPDRVESVLKLRLMVTKWLCLDITIYSSVKNNWYFLSFVLSNFKHNNIINYKRQYAGNVEVTEGFNTMATTYNTRFAQHSLKLYDCPKIHSADFLWYLGNHRVLFNRNQQTNYQKSYTGPYSTHGWVLFPIYVCNDNGRVKVSYHI